MFEIIIMLKQAEKWFPDLGTMVSGHLLIYVISAKGNHERIIPGVILRVVLYEIWRFRFPQ